MQNDKFELPDGFYSLSDIEYIIKKTLVFLKTYNTEFNDIYMYMYIFITCTDKNGILLEI